MGNTHSKGVAICKFPGELFLSIQVYLVEANILILLSLAEMDKHQLEFDNTMNILVHKPTGATEKIARRFGHPKIIWNQFTGCFFITAELSRLHRRFGHPHTDKLINLIKRAATDQLDKKNRLKLEKIVWHCRLCQINAQNPRRSSLHFAKRSNSTKLCRLMYSTSSLRASSILWMKQHAIKQQDSYHPWDQTTYGPLCECV